MRNLRLLPTCLIVAAGIFPVLVACGGKEVSLGTNKAQLALVDPTAVSGTVPACNSGDAHPNVCCQAVAGQAASCGVFPGAPFQPCDSGWTAYPDPRSCCALEDPSSCAAPPTTSPPSPPGTCGYACEPGWYPIQNGCCQATNGPDGVCYGWASSGDAGTFDGGSADGGVEVDAGCVDPGFGDGGTNGCDPTPVPPTEDAGTNLPTVPCDYACPTGWQRASGAPDVCCRDLGGGEFECFSQATGPSSGGGSTEPDGGVFVDGGEADVSVPPTVDAGVDDANTMACGGNTNGDCFCELQNGTHTYELDCSNTAQTCTCILDGVGTSTSNVMECGDPDGGGPGVHAFWANVCHFPNQ